ncbi:Nramp family divalent metal transporter [Actinopolymorpha sp. B17G11]|uniref:Nramp family divalent metal transporter n=1 Tax=Actinopolymorpha sp. B17G11 TaxID=3160861 RepID=UPI0032E47B14
MASEHGSTDPGPPSSGPPGTPSDDAPPGGGAYTSTLSTRHLPGVEVRDLPAAPTDTWRILGPGLVGAGVGLASGEFILWPYIASQVGLVFLWGAVIGVMTQWFLNMEIERYTLATGETALTGFSRLWKHWGLVFAVMTYFANMWPGWATSSATLVSYIFGGNVTAIAIAILLICGAVLTLAPVVYTALERVIVVKVAAIGVFILVAIIFAITGDAWRNLGQAVTHIGQFPDLQFALMLGAIAYAGAGGGQNLCQSNWIRDKRFGMGAYVPRLVSPVTGQEEAAPSTGYVFAPVGDNLTRWRAWWRFANLEQAATFVLITAFTIGFMSMLAFSTVFGREGLPDDIAFLQVEGNALKESVGPWFGYFFWVIGAYALFAGAMGIIDYTSRLAADLVATVYLRGSGVSESRVYFWLVWGLVAFGCLVLLAGLDQPLVLLVISSCVAGVMMAIYGVLLILMNKRALPPAIRIKTFRTVVIALAVVFYGTLGIITIIQQGSQLFE